MLEERLWVVAVNPDSSAKILGSLRRAKHLVFVGGKNLSRWRTEAGTHIGDVLYPRLSRIEGYEFDPSRYRRSFIVRNAPRVAGPTDLKRRVFVFWTGDNDMSRTRRENLQRMREVIGVPVVLVTPDNLKEWVLPGVPLHPAYEYLSLVHRSDYLRAYFLRHHGGGYCDLKLPYQSWAPVFDDIQQDVDMWVTGCWIASARFAMNLPGKLGRDLKVHHRRLVGASHMWGRPNTPFTAEWMREVDSRMDYFADQLSEYPGGLRGDVVGYPVSWHDLLAKIYQPLCLKYQSHIRVDDRLLISWRDYM